MFYRSRQQPRTRRFIDPMEEQSPAKAKPTRSVGSSMARGAAWMVALQSADRALGFVSILVLARLLVPADFGLVALGMAVVGGLAAFSEFGFDLALIQNQSAVRRHYDTAWTLTLLRGFFLTGLLLLISEPNAALMGDERLVDLVYALALVPFIESFINIGIVDFRKELVFRKEFFYRLTSRLGGVVVTVTLAFFWRDYWVLVAGQVTASSLRLLLSYTLHPYRPRPSLAAWRELFHFSKWLFLNGLAQFATRRASIFIVGAFLTPAAVGLFTVSGTVTGAVSQAFVAPVKRTFFPGFAKLSNDMAAMRDVLLSAYALTVLIALPLCVGIGLTAEYVVPLAFGDQWLEAVPVIQILIFSALANALQGPVRPLLLAINRPELVTSLSIVNAAIIIPALIVGTWIAGLEGAAWALVAENTAMMIVQHSILRRFLRISMMDVLSRIWRALAACGVLALALWSIKTAVVPPPNVGIIEDLAGLILLVAAGALAYTVALLCFWAICGRPAGSAEGVVLALLKRKLLRKGPPAGKALTSGGKTGS
jgi:PST family polysaccharide transporter